MNTKHHLKTILPLAAVAAAFTLAPVAQAEVIDSYSIKVTSTTSSWDYIAPDEILNPDGLNILGPGGSSAGPYTFEAGTEGTIEGLGLAGPVGNNLSATDDQHATDHNGSGMFQTSEVVTGPTGSGTPVWIKFDLGQNYDLEKLRVWNGDYFRDAAAGGYGANQTDLYYSSAEADPGDDFNTNWTSFGGTNLTAPTLASGGVSAGLWGPTDEIDLTGTNARWFAMNVTSTHGQDWFRIAEVQFIEAVGPTAPFAITEIDYAPDTGMLTLTWNSSPNETYGVYLSTDMIDWGFELDDSIPADADETTTTAIFDLNDTWPEGIPESVYFRVEK